MPANPEPFRCAIPEADLADLGRRLASARLPREPADAAWQFGSNTAYMQALLQHWRQGFDWRAWETRLNRFPQFRVSLTRRDTGQPQVVHFIHEPGSGPEPRPLLITHGWPGSVFEFIDVIERLAHPERFGGDVADAFTVICPSLPGYGFSLPLEQPIAPRQVAALWRDLMVEALGFPRFFAQAGDWGSIISSWLGIDHPAHVAALHLNMVPLRPPIDAASAPLSDAEKAWGKQVKQRHAAEGGYFAIQSTKPTTLAYGLSDSPAGLAGWIVEKFHGHPRAKADQGPVFSMDAMLATISLYWFTNTAASSSWMYWAAVRAGDLAMRPGDFCTPPTAFLLPPWDLVPPAPPGWLERGYNVARRTDLPRGGHFVAMEQPDAFVHDVTEFFRHQTLHSGDRT